MPTTHIDAADSMRSQFFLSWLDWITNGKPVNIREPNGDREVPLLLLRADNEDPYVPEVVWGNVERKDPNDNAVHWARFNQTVVDTKQTTFRNVEGQVRYTEYGNIIIQLFFSKSAFETDIDRKLSVIARDLFRGRNVRANSVWYKRARIKPLDPEEAFFRANVITDYQFDEIA